jgi:hypothetical protein
MKNPRGADKMKNKEKIKNMDLYDTVEFDGKRWTRVHGCRLVMESKKPAVSFKGTHCGSHSTFFNQHDGAPVTINGDLDCSVKGQIRSWSSKFPNHFLIYRRRGNERDQRSRKTGPGVGRDRVLAGVIRSGAYCLSLHIEKTRCGSWRTTLFGNEKGNSGKPGAKRIAASSLKLQYPERKGIEQNGLIHMMAFKAFGDASYKRGKPGEALDGRQQNPLGLSTRKSADRHCPPSRAFLVKKEKVYDYSRL